MTGAPPGKGDGDLPLAVWRKSASVLRIMRPVIITFLGLGLLGLGGCVTPAASRPKSPPKLSPRDQAVQLQIFLDSQGFGPGVVDGRPGEFTAKALALYRHAKGLPVEANPEVGGISPYTTYTITEADLAALGTMAAEPAEIAKQKRLPYVGLGELLGERFHTTREFIHQLNPGVALDALSPGAVVKVPNVSRPFYADRFPSAYSRLGGPARSVLVDTNLRMLEVREGGKLLAAFPITPGSTEHPAPIGEWKIAGIAPWPWYRYDEGVLKRGERTQTFFMFPPGVNSPVGILWAGLNRPGTGIHGTAYPETIGRSGSHGCIRLANWDAATFYTLAQKGMPVTIR